MFCNKCGKEVQEEWAVCPNCGCKLNEKKEAIEDIVQEQKEYHLLGMRRTGRFSFWKIHSTVKVEGDDIDIITNGKKIVENRFKKQEILGIDFPILPIWNAIDIIALALSGIFMFFTYGLSIFFMLLYIKMAVSRHLRIKLNSGVIVSVPICQKADASEVLKELDYPKEEIEKIEKKRISSKKWANREWIVTMLLLFIAGFTLYLGFNMKSNSMQNNVIHSEALELVQNGTLGYYTDTHVKDVLEYTWPDGIWDSFEGERDNGEPILVVEYAENKDRNTMIQFGVDLENDQFNIVHMKIDGKALTKEELTAEIDEMYFDYYTEE